MRFKVLFCRGSLQVHNGPQTTVYQELTKHSEICDVLTRSLGSGLATMRSPTSNDVSLDKKFDLHCFAKYTTHRKTLSMEASSEDAPKNNSELQKLRCTIDLDTVDFDYKVGEIEVVVEAEDEIPLALQRISEFAQTYGLELDQSTNDKSCVRGTRRCVRSKLLQYLVETDQETMLKLDSFVPSRYK